MNKKRTCYKSRNTVMLLLAGFMAFWMFLGAGVANATFNVAEEKTDAKFTKEGDLIVATLIPRAKSNSVSIYFKVSGAKLADVQAMDIKEAKHPKIDHKDFKSELFKASIHGVSRGGEVKLFVRSDFFSKSTQYWIFNPESAEKWMDSQAPTFDRGNLVQELVVTAKDGGKFDADGAADGRLTIIGGPKDSFWGYALGTLFIRFFGIFLVLSVLMIGMLISGRIFQQMEKKDASAAAPAVPEQSDEPQKTDASVTMDEKNEDEIAAAISTALYMHFCEAQCDDSVCLFCPETASWTQQGRERIMGVRNMALSRVNRQNN